MELKNDDKVNDYLVSLQGSIWIYIVVAECGYFTDLVITVGFMICSIALILLRGIL